MVKELDIKKRATLTYRYDILFVFVLFEVLLYDSSSLVQPAISILEYLFVFYALMCDRRLGIMYFISFTLLSLGTWSYVIQPTLPNNFWGIRLAGLSLNFFFSVFICFYTLFSSLKRFTSNEEKKYNRFFFSFIIYTFLLGCVYALLAINYPDNLLKDTSIYLPFFIYTYLLSKLDYDSAFRVLQHGISLTVVTMFLSLVTGIMFQYSPENYFLLMNGYAFILLFTIFMMRKIYKPTHYWTLVALMLLMLVSGRFFIGGKFIILAIVTLLWLGLRNKKVLLWTLFGVLVIFAFIGPIMDILSENFSESLVITHKFTQIFEIFEIVDVDTIASTNSSMGNIFAEARTTFTYLWHNPGFLLFGKGLGGGIQDVFGYFRPVAGPDTGYTYNDVIRNDYFRMHLPLFEIAIKSGLIGLAWYIYMVVKSFRLNHIFGFALFILLFTVFFNSKEMMLLTLLFLKVSSNYTFKPLHE